MFALAMALELAPDFKKFAEESKKNQGISAKFEQTTDIRATKVQKKESGQIWIKRPDQYRWETQKPDVAVFVSDGKTLKNYTPPFDDDDVGQGTVRSAKSVQTQFLQTLLMGDFDRIEGKVKDLGAHRVEITPVEGKAGDVARAEVEFDGPALKAIILDHKSGNKTRLDLRDFQFVKVMESKLFQYEFPKKTKVSKE